MRSNDKLPEQQQQPEIVAEPFYNSGTYEITITPADNYQHYGSYKGGRLRKFVTGIQSQLQQILDPYDIKYYLQIELSEPHININNNGKFPRLHYHGLIIFKTQLQAGIFLLESIYRLSRFSNITINKHDDDREEYWAKYMNKQNEIMTLLCKEYQVPYQLKHKQPALFIKKRVKFKPTY